MHQSIRAGVAIALMNISASVQAAELGDRTSLVCGLIDLHCAAGDACRRESAATLNLPTVIKIDVGAKTIVGKDIDGDGKSTSIGNMQHNDQGLVLQGVDGERSWNAVVARDGALSIAAVGPDGAFLIFGEWAAP